jgi:hypothetical protein
MWFSSWQRERNSKRPPRDRALNRFTAPRIRPHVEALEDLLVLSGSPTIINVTSRADSGKNTLRAAILQANKDHGPRTYEIDITVPGTILLESSLPELTGDISAINGLGSSRTLIQRDTLAALFRLLTVDAGETATLSGLGMTQGKAGSGTGGVIDNFGALSLQNCALFANTAASAGAVANETGASLTVAGASFSGNHVAGGNGGGAIWNDGTLAVQGGSSFSGNTAPSSFGGAIFNATTATVSQSTFANNSAANAGAPENVSGGSLRSTPAVSRATRPGQGARFAASARWSSAARRSRVTPLAPTAGRSGARAPGCQGALE